MYSNKIIINLATERYNYDSGRFQDNDRTGLPDWVHGCRAGLRAGAGPCEGFRREVVAQDDACGPQAVQRNGERRNDKAEKEGDGEELAAVLLEGGDKESHADSQGYDAERKGTTIYVWVTHLAPTGRAARNECDFITICHKFSIGACRLRVRAPQWDKRKSSLTYW